MNGKTKFDHPFLTMWFLAACCFIVFLPQTQLFDLEFYIQHALCICADNICVVDISLACCATDYVVHCSPRCPVIVCLREDSGRAARPFYSHCRRSGACVSPLLAGRGSIEPTPSAASSPASLTTSAVSWTQCTRFPTLSSPCPPSESSPNQKVGQLSSFSSQLCAFVGKDVATVERGCGSWRLIKHC